jgi:hypothetical protein
MEGVHDAALVHRERASQESAPYIGYQASQNDGMMEDVRLLKDHGTIEV